MSAAPTGPDLTDEQLAGLEVARTLARAGVPLFVAPPLSSDPSGFALPKGWPTTRPGEHSLAAVDRWRPGWALCAVMGHAVDALDVDPRHGGQESVRELVEGGVWPRAILAVAETPSGGWHALVPALGVGSRDGVRPGLDVKGGRPDGAGRGFVFVAPTERVSKADGERRSYRWQQAPDGIAERLEGPNVRNGLSAFAEVVTTALTRPAPSSSAPGGTGGEAGDREHSGPIPDGERHAALVSYAGRLRNRGLSFDEASVLMLERWKACAQPPAARYPLPQAEALDKLRDVYGRYPAGEVRPDLTVLDLPPSMAPAAPLATVHHLPVASDSSVMPTSWDGQADGERPVASWGRTDLRPYLDGTFVAPVPTLLPRADGVCLLYRGLVHSLHGESESGKSWIAQAEAARILLDPDGGVVLYCDFESDAGAITDRLMLLGVPAAVLAERLDYRRPEASPTALHELEAWADMLGRPYTLAVVDGVTDALGLFGAKTTDNDEVAAWLRRFPRQLARRTGAAVVLIDHVTKDSETRGRFALGGQAKMNGLDGAAYVVDLVDPLGKGLRGVLTLRVAKDRPGTVRGKAGPMRKGDRTQEAARFVLDSTGDRPLATLEAPDMTDHGGEGFRPTALMERTSRVVEGNPGVGVNTIKALVGGNTKMRDRALALLITEGYVATAPAPRNGVSHTCARPYREADDKGGAPVLPSLEMPLAATGTDSNEGSRGVGTARPAPTGTTGTDRHPTGTTVPVTDWHHRPPPIGDGASQTPACAQCGRSSAHHSKGQWSTCETCGTTWHRWGAGGVARCPGCAS